MVHGLTRAGEEEPETSEELLAMLVEIGDIDVLEALVDVRREHVGGEFGVYAAGRALARLQAAKPSADDGLSALRQSIYEDLAADERQELPPTLSRHLSAALLAFAEGRDLRAPTEAALAAARTTMSELEKLSDNTPAERQRSFHALRELDRGLLETATLSELLTVCGHEAGGAGPAAGASADLLERLSNWILSREERPLQPGAIPHAVLRLRRLRTLLHLLDVDVPAARGAPDHLQPPASAPAPLACIRPCRRLSGGDRRLAALRLLLGRLESDPPSPLRRTVCAALARACDALVRDELCELSDILVAISTKVRLPGDLEVLAEASMVTEVQDMFRASAQLARMVAGGPQSDRRALVPGRLRRPGPDAAAGDLPRASRACVGRCWAWRRALEWLHKAQALAALRQEDGRAALERLEDTLQYAAKLCAGVRRRLGLGGASSPPTLGRVGARPGPLDRAGLPGARGEHARRRAAGHRGGARRPAGRRSPRWWPGC